MHINALPSEQLAILADLPPAEVSAGTAELGPSGARIDMRDCESVMVIIHVGALGNSATVDAKLLEYKASTGTTDEQEISGKAITQLTQSGDDDSDQVAIINLRREELSEGYRYVACEIEVGTAASDVSAIAIGIFPSYGPADDHNVDDVAEIV